MPTNQIGKPILLDLLRSGDEEKTLNALNEIEAHPDNYSGDTTTLDALMVAYAFALDRHNQAMQDQALELFDRLNQ